MQVRDKGESYARVAALLCLSMTGLSTACSDSVQLTSDKPASGPGEMWDEKEEASTWPAAEEAQLASTAAPTLRRDPKEFGARGDGETDDTKAFLRAATSNVPQGTRVILSLTPGIYALQNLNLPADLEFKAGAFLKALSPEAGNIILAGKITAPRTQIFSGDALLPRSRISNVESYLYGNTTPVISYPIRSHVSQTVNPEWWGATGWQQGEDYALIQKLVLSDKALFDSRAFFGMHQFLAQGNPGAYFRVSLSPRATYLFHYTRWMQMVRNLEIEGNNAAIGAVGEWKWGHDIGLSAGSGGQWLVSSPDPGFPNTLAKFGVQGENQADIPAGAKTLRTLGDHPELRYPLGSLVFLCSWMQYSGGWPPSCARYSFHKVKAIEGQRVALDPPVPETHAHSAFEFTFKTNTLGKPALFAEPPRLMRNFYAHDLRILPNPTKAAGGEFRTVFHMTDIVFGTMENIEFLSHPTNSTRYTYPSSGYSYTYKKIRGNPLMEIDKNIGSLLVDDFQGNICGGTGAKKVKIQNSQLLSPIYSSNTVYLKTTFQNMNALHTNIGRVESVTTDGQALSAPANSPNMINSVSGNPETGETVTLDTAAGRLSLITEANLQNLAATMPGRRFLVLQRQPASWSFTGTWGTLGNLRDFRELDLASGRKAIEFDSKFCHQPTKEFATTPQNLTKPLYLYFPKFDYANTGTGASDSIDNATPFFHVLPRSFVNGWWSGNSRSGHWSHALPKSDQLAKFHPQFYFPVGPVQVGSLEIEVIEPYQGNDPRDIFLSLSASYANIGSYFAGDEKIDLKVKGKRIVKGASLTPLSSKDVLLPLNEPVFGFAMIPSVDSTPVFAAKKELLPTDWDQSTPRVRVSYTASRLLFEGCPAP